MVKYTPKILDEVRRCLGGCSGETLVDVEEGIPVTAKTVADVRALSSWPPGNWVLDIPAKGRRQTIQRGKGEVAFLHRSLTCLADACFIVRDATGQALRLLIGGPRAQDKGTISA